MASCGDRVVLMSAPAVDPPTQAHKTHHSQVAPLRRSWMFTLRRGWEAGGQGDGVGLTWGAWGGDKAVLGSLRIAIKT